MFLGQTALYSNLLLKKKPQHNNLEIFLLKMSVVGVGRIFLSFRNGLWVVKDHVAVR